MIKTVNLGKEYGDFWAVRDLNINLRGGEIYGFLGPNGAGKTTTILMILSILRPTMGHIYLFGEQLNGSRVEIRSRIGVVSEKQYFYPEMTMREYLDFFGELYQVRNRRQRIGELAERVELVNVLDKRMRAFSRGMQQKVGFVRALLHEPELLILDEPVSGLDPMGIRQVRGLIEGENKRGKTVFISSHLLSEIEKLCDRVAIMNNGRLLAEDRMENLVRRLTEESELDIELAEGKPGAIDELEGLDFVNGVSIDGKFLRVKVKTDQDYRLDVVQTLISQGYVPVGIQVRSMSFEEAFVTITKENISLLAEVDS
jgi:ABC-2 type transport system ATP-binding protein